MSEEAVAAVRAALAPYELRFGTAGLLVDEAALLAVQAAAPVLRRQLAAEAAQEASAALQAATEQRRLAIEALETNRAIRSTLWRRTEELVAELDDVAAELVGAQIEAGRYRDALARIDRGEGDAQRIARETLGPVRR